MSEPSSPAAVLPLLERLGVKDATKYAGRWVAVKDDEVIHAADDLNGLGTWLNKYNAAPDLVFRVPEENEPVSFH